LAQAVLDSFRNIVGSKLQMNFRSCSKKLNSVLSLTVDRIGQYTHGRRYVIAPFSIMTLLVEQ